MTPQRVGGRGAELMDTPLVSIVTPSFDQGRYLGDCIDSIQRQTYDAVEHVIADGGSTDETLNVLAGAPANVRWRSEPDRGQADAINKAFAETRGDIVGWLNSDDAYFDRRAIARAVDILRRRPEVDLVYGHAALVSADNEVLQLLWAPPFSARLLRYVNFIVQPTVFVRRTALGETLVDETLEFVVDRELWMRLSREGRGFARLDLVVAVDRHHGSRKSHTIEDVGRCEDKQIADRHGVPAGALRVVIPQAYRIASRVLGTRLLRQVEAAPAIDVRSMRAATLLRRQLLTRRRDMPLLDEPADR
jgi:glycosyltransferase involved in cell wall biosynthesis